jgi:hypothetical protein
MNGYRISYGPPSPVKERPHRELDTARERRGVSEYYEFDYGQVTFMDAPEIGDGVEVVKAQIEELATGGE